MRAENPIRGCEQQNCSPSRPVPLENAIRLLSCASSFVRRLGVFVDEAAQDRFSVDLLRIEAGGGGAGLLVCPVRDALVDALVRPGAVAVGLVVGSGQSEGVPG